MENWIFFLIILINGFTLVTSGEVLLSRRVARQVTPSSICFPDPSNPPPQMPQCFCCICAGISPFCRGLGPITTRRPTTLRPMTTTPRTPPPITVPCVDGNANCRTWVSNGFCTNPAYTLAQRQQFCAQSCSLCGKSIQSNTDSGTPNGPLICGDAGASCSTWIKNGFCTSPNYTLDQRKQYCGKSCNLC